MYELIALNAFTLLILLGIITALRQTKQMHPDLNKKITRTVALLLLSINVVKFITVDGFIPVEFSTVSYYVVPIILLLGIKKLEIWAVYAGLMAGFFYYLTMLVQGGVIYETYPPLTIHISLFCHGALMFLSLFKLSTETYRHSERYKLVIGLALMISYALYMRQYLVIEERLFIYELLDAVYIKAFTSNILAIIGYYVVIILLTFKSTKLIFTINRIMNHHYDELKAVPRYKQVLLKKMLGASIVRTSNFK